MTHHYNDYQAPPTSEQNAARRIARDVPAPTREPENGACEVCKQMHPVLEWEGLRWCCPPCLEEMKEDAAYHALTGGWR